MTNGMILSGEQKAEITRQANAFISEATSQIETWEARKGEAIKMDSQFTPRLVVMIEETIEHLKNEIEKSKQLKEIVRNSA